MPLSFTVHPPVPDATGPINDLVLIHGWGMHCGVFQPCIDQWRQHFRVLTLDLPGHGLNHQIPLTCDMSGLCDEIIHALDRVGPVQCPATWLGWSLGGQVTLSISLSHPQRVSRLVLVSSTPKFVVAPDWPDGMPDETFASFASDLEFDHQATWKRFLMLETHGAKTPRQDLRQLHTLAAEHPAPSQTTLASGLELLRTNDLRSRASTVIQPTLVISGQRDRLVPPAAAQWLAERIPKAELELMARCGHAPFIGAPQRFIQRVYAFAQNSSASQPVAGYV